jgi:peptide methionine sulfoxide reductase msrA/msrB
MKKVFLVITILICAVFQACTQNKTNMQLNKLTPEEERIIKYKGTERPFSGAYDKFFKNGTYYCKQCGAALYRSSDKFDSGCGWPAFDDEIPGAIKHLPDADGRRTEIQCAACGGHLGHVFEGERLTNKNVRHCVNSLSLTFKDEPMNTEVKTEKAYFAGGCFWGVEHYMKDIDGVLSTSVGYMGGKTKNPSYEDVCSHTTGHAEVVEVVWDPAKTNFEKVAKMFFEIHDPTQVNRQGPDIGDQYRSEIFYTSEEQSVTAQKLIDLLKQKGYKVATKITKAPEYYKGEGYHQNYYEKKGSLPYCHAYTKRF